MMQSLDQTEEDYDIPELEAFQRYLTPQYQIKVMSRQNPFPLHDG